MSRGNEYARASSYFAMKAQRDAALDEARAMREQLGEAIDEIARLKALLAGRPPRNLITEIAKERHGARRPPQPYTATRSR